MAIPKISAYRCSCCGETAKKIEDILDEIEVYECPHCGDLHEDELDAEFCCKEVPQ